MDDAAPVAEEEELEDDEEEQPEEEADEEEENDEQGSDAGQPVIRAVMFVDLFINHCQLLLVNCLPLQWMYNIKLRFV